MFLSQTSSLSPMIVFPRPRTQITKSNHGGREYWHFLFKAYMNVFAGLNFVITMLHLLSEWITFLRFLSTVFVGRIYLVQPQRGLQMQRLELARKD